MRYFTDSILLLLYSTLTFFYVPADQALVFALLFAVILCCITYLCRVCKTESCSHNSLPVLKPAGNIIPVLAGSYVIFGLCSLWFSDFLLFFPLLLYQTLSAGLFPLAVAALPLWGFLVFQINRFPAVLCLLGIFGFVLSFFLWLYAGKYQALYQDFHQIRDDSEEHTLLLSEKNKALLEKQISSSVRWQQSVENMIRQGVDTFVEIGPGRTLAGFMRKIDRNVKVYNIQTVEDAEKVCQELK